MSASGESRSPARRYVLLATGVLALRRDDFLLTGFPRSGTTWTRHVLCNLISLNEWDGAEVESVLNETMPALGANDLSRPWPHVTMPRVVKTHHRYSPLLRKPRSVSLIRDPRDVMVSRYHLIRDKRGESEGPFDEFIRDGRQGLESWFKHFVSWRPHSKLVLRYEDMLADPHLEFGRLLDTLGVDRRDEMLAEAIARSSFRSLQLAEKRRKPTVPEDGLFFRSGSSGRWRERFSEDDLNYYHELATKYDVGEYA